MQWTRDLPIRARGTVPSAILTMIAASGLVGASAETRPPEPPRVDSTAATEATNGNPPFTIVVEPISICGTDDLHDITCYKAGQQCANPAMYQRGTAVARVRMLARDSQYRLWQYLGSSFLFVPPAPWAARRDLMLTNRHVLTPDPGERVVSVQVEFFAEYAPDCVCGNANPPLACGPGVPNCFPPFTKCVGIKRGIACWNLDPVCDWGVFRLKENAPAAAVAAPLGMNPIPGDIVYIPQHPGGRCKEIDTASVIAVPEGCEFTHVVDTEKGSSGSPVIYFFTNEVRGIHYRGGCGTDLVTNGAVKIDVVKALLPVRIPPVIACPDSAGPPVLPDYVPLLELPPDSDGERVYLTCGGDLNFDGVVDAEDLGILLAAWGSDDVIAEIDGDGTVNGADLGILLALWGPCQA